MVKGCRNVQKSDLIHNDYLPDIEVDPQTYQVKADDVVLESLAVGAEGWVSGMSNVFPKEGETIFRLAKAGRFAEAMPIYEWLMPILHLDARADLVQCIKLCEAIAGRGSALTRPPRLALPREDREFVEQIMARALANRPHLPDVGL